MKKRKVIFIIIVILLILGIIGACIGSRIRDKRRELRVRVMIYDEYCRILCMPGLRVEDYDDLSHVVMDAQPNEEERKELLIRVAYYNLEMGEDVTMEQVLDAYNAFLAGDEEGDALASQPTVSRFFNCMDEDTLNQFLAIARVLRKKIYSIQMPSAVILDLASTLLDAYGRQEGRAFNFHFQILFRE